MTDSQTIQLLDELEVLVRNIRIQGQKESEGKSQDERNALLRKFKGDVKILSQIIADKNGLPRSQLEFYIALAIKMDEQKVRAGYYKEEPEEDSQSDAAIYKHINEAFVILVLLIAAGIVYWSLRSLGAFK